MKNIPQRRMIGEQGFVLLSAYLVISVMVIISISVYFHSMSSHHTNERNQNRTAAFGFAESGLDEVIVQLRNQDGTQSDNFARYPCASGTDYDQDGNGSNEGCTQSYSAMDATGIRGGYQVWVNDPIDPTSVYRQIRVAGHVPADGSATTSGQCTGASSTENSYECRSVEAYVELDDTLFEHAVFSETDLTLNGSSTLIDSYDSSSGSYGGSNIGANGDIGSNGSVAGGEISLNGNPVINGAIMENLGIECPAVTATPPISTMGNLRVNNTYTLPAATNNIYRYDYIRIQSNNGLLHIGPTDPMDPNYGLPVTIYVDGDLTVNAGEIQAHSPVIFYVGGDVNMAGNGVTTSGDDPSNMIVYMTGSGNVSVSGGSEFHGAIFAPDSVVDVNGGIEFYGAIFGADFDGNGAGAIHYDQVLENMKLPCAIVRFRSWREIETLLGT